MPILGLIYLYTYISFSCLAYHSKFVKTHLRNQVHQKFHTNGRPYRLRAQNKYMIASDSSLRCIDEQLYDQRMTHHHLGIANCTAIPQEMLAGMV
jgi:hypothetical protein